MECVRANFTQQFNLPMKEHPSYKAIRAESAEGELTNCKIKYLVNQGDIFLQPECTLSTQIPATLKLGLGSTGSPMRKKKKHCFRQNFGNSLLSANFYWEMHKQLLSDCKERPVWRFSSFVVWKMRFPTGSTDIWNRFQATLLWDRENLKLHTGVE